MRKRLFPMMIFILLCTALAACAKSPSDSPLSGDSRYSDFQSDNSGYGDSQSDDSQSGDSRQTCAVVLEDNEAFEVKTPVLHPDRGTDAVFSLRVKEGYTLTGVDYENYSMESDGAETILTLHEVFYPTVISVTAKKADVTFQYAANGGLRLDGGSSDIPITVSVTDSKLRHNTSIGIDLFAREGYTLTGWNTSADGTGTAVGLGSRIGWTEGLTLYAQWSKWTDGSLFSYRQNGDGIAITDYRGTDETLTIPATLDGYKVLSIDEYAFANCLAKTIILPPGLRTVSAYAFCDSAVETLYLSDDIGTVSDYAFQNCPAFSTLHINAVEPPVYSTNYYATFQDKFDRLLALKNQKKIVLFSGSSARFGYDSAMLDEAFADYEIVNMGVFAYTNAFPQFLLILDCMQAGDILLHSPEFDAAQRQFCVRTELDAPFFCMMEANYDTLALLDLRETDLVFTAFNSYLKTKETLAPQDYSLSPADYDEDGAVSAGKSYNEYGDYILYRPNADTDEPVYGLPVKYTVSAFPDNFIESLNRMYTRYLDRGITVYFTYAPRNSLALSDDSTAAERQKLHAYFQEMLCVPVISDLEESLYPGRYLYGTDNHLSTEGVSLRTEQIIKDLKAAGIR